MGNTVCPSLAKILEQRIIAALGTERRLPAAACAFVLLKGKTCVRPVFQENDSASMAQNKAITIGRRILMHFNNIPIGFSMALAQNEDAANAYAMMTGEQKQAILDKAQSVQSESEMRSIIAHLAAEGRV